MSNRNRPTGSGFSIRTDAPTPEEVARLTYGGAGAEDPTLAALDAQRQVAKLIPLAEVIPDRRQPRREFPHQVAPREYTPEAINQAILEWLALAEAESGHAFPMGVYFEPQGEWERPERPKPIERRLIRLVSLAADIYHVGKLIEPIQVTQDGDRRYRITHGERRWLAHWIAYMWSGSEDFLQIMAHKVSVHSVWQQASENGVRSDLNAVSRVRQLALLIMDLHTRADHHFADMDELVEPGECDRAFYAQVADGTEYPILYRETERIARVTGLSPTQQRQYRRILRASDALWLEADDADLTEGEIRHKMAIEARSVTGVTDSGSPPKPFVLKVGAQTVPKWEQVKARMPDTPDSQIVDSLVDFYLAHQESGEQ